MDCNNCPTVTAQDKMVVWPNGKASDYESEDCGFDPHHDQRFFLPWCCVVRDADGESFVGVEGLQGLDNS